MKISTLLQQFCGALSVAGLCLASPAALAGPVNLVKNGGFELNTGTGQVNHTTVVTDWSSPGGFNFVFAPGTADTTGSSSWFDGPNDMPVKLWGANNGGDNALAQSADGGYFLAADGAYGVQAITQMISGLEVGQTYKLSFEWGAAQQYLFHGDTQEWWKVSIGDNNFQTDVYNLKQHSSSSWMQEAFFFTATKTDELLSFLAAGTPEGFPPFSLLDGVSLVATGDNTTVVVPVPAPSTWLTTVGGLALLGAVLRRRRKSGAA